MLVPFRRSKNSLRSISRRRIIFFLGNHLWGSSVGGDGNGGGRNLFETIDADKYYVYSETMVIPYFLHDLLGVEFSDASKIDFDGREKRKMDERRKEKIEHNLSLLTKNANKS